MENNINEGKIYAALNSLARFLDFKENSAPDIVIRLEKDILSKHFNNLNKYEFKEISHRWPPFYKKRQKSLETEALIIQESFENQAL